MQQFADASHVVLVDLDGQITAAPPSVEDVFGQPLDEILGQSLDALVQPAQGRVVDSLFPGDTHDVRRSVLAAPVVGDPTPHLLVGTCMRACDGTCHHSVMLSPICRQAPNERTAAGHMVERSLELESVLANVLELVQQTLGSTPLDNGPAPSRQAVLEVLSLRERQIVVLLARNMRVPAIANELFIAPSTVRNHLSSAFRKLGVGTQVELIELLR